MIKFKNFNGFSLPLIVFAALLLAISGCSSDDTAPATLTATVGDGVAELTGVPAFAASTFSTSDTVMVVNIPVDSDTTALDVFLHPVGDANTTPALANNQSVTASMTNAITLSFFSTPTAGTAYYI